VFIFTIFQAMLNALHSDLCACDRLESLSIAEGDFGALPDSKVLVLLATINGEVAGLSTRPLLLVDGQADIMDLIESITAEMVYGSILQSSLYEMAKICNGLSTTTTNVPAQVCEPATLNKAEQLNP
jgi:hypothetical protein